MPGDEAKTGKACPVLVREEEEEEGAGAGGVGVNGALDWDWGVPAVSSSFLSASPPPASRVEGWVAEAGAGVARGSR